MCAEVKALRSVQSPARSVPRVPACHGAPPRSCRLLGKRWDVTARCVLDIEGVSALPRSARSLAPRGLARNASVRARTRSFCASLMSPAEQRHSALSFMNSAEATSETGKIESRSRNIATLHRRLLPGAFLFTVTQCSLSELRAHADAEVPLPVPADQPGFRTMRAGLAVRRAVA
jgi:hypothetical protein